MPPSGTIDEVPWRATAQAAHEVAGERHLAAEQMGAAGDVEQEAILAGEPDQRRVAIAHVGDRLEQARVRVPVGIDAGELRIHRPGIGERHAGGQAETLGGVVERREAQRALDRFDDDERRISRRA